METFVALGSIILIDLIMSGDNAIVIALASRNLPVHQQKKAIFWGVFGAVFFRVLLTIIASFLLQVPYLMLAGGIALFFIAVRMLAPAPSKEAKGKEASNLLEAIRIILFADVIMSLDNILAIAGIAGGNIILLTFGLLLSIPIVIFGSTFLLKIMSKHPIFVYIGACVLGWTAGKMIVNDAAVLEALSPFSMIIEIGLTMLTLAAGYWLRRRQSGFNCRLLG